MSDTPEAGPAPEGLAAPEASAAPVVSVVIPAHNRAGRVAQAIESVSRQTFRDLEILVVDDGSTDETVEVARAIAATEPRLRVLTLPSNRGAQAARNAGIRAARGEWIAFLDSDDTYYPNSVAARLELVVEGGFDVVHSDCDAFDSNGPVPTPIRGVAGQVYRDLLTGPGPMFQGLLVRRTLLERIGLLDEAVPSYQEWDTSIRLAAEAAFGYLPAATFRYDRGTAGAISGDPRRSARGYGYVVGKHRRAILRVAGFRALAGHYRQLAEMRAQAGDRGAALVRLGFAQVLWPFSPRRSLRVLRRILRGSGVADAASAGRSIKRP